MERSFDEDIKPAKPVKRTILLVDDEKKMRSRYKKVLKREGFRVIEAPNALEVANILMREKSKLELIVLDINIREVDGRDIFDIIAEYAPDLQVIVSSVLPIGEQKIRIPRAADYFCKANKDSLLVSKVKNIIGTSPVQV